MMPATISTKDTMILDVLARTGCLTIEQLAAELPELTWNELFHTIDQLSRSGAIRLQRKGFAFELQLNIPERIQALDSTAKTGD
ncbi:MAG: hypothetical protein ACKOCD_11100 [Nitrospiraceae bacterium]